MSKRRRASSGASRGADGDYSDDGVELHSPGPPPSRKKKKLDPVSYTVSFCFVDQNLDVGSVFGCYKL